MTVIGTSSSKLRVRLHDDALELVGAIIPPQKLRKRASSCRRSTPTQGQCKRASRSQSETSCGGWVGDYPQPRQQQLRQCSTTTTGITHPNRTHTTRESAGRTQQSLRRYKNEMADA
ncbi:hypothetical protein NL676_006120 [Syzygium grande]|nr:hypothetical protein NL676_006120 [Syzygium grande]